MAAAKREIESLIEKDIDKSDSGRNKDRKREREREKARGRSVDLTEMDFLSNEIHL